MNTANRPLSPHLGIYRKQLTSVMSISHRLTGIALAAASLILVYWLFAVAGGPETYQTAQRFLGSFAVQLVLLAGTFALFYHLSNGVRHLFWDAGFGFELKTAYASGAAVIVASIVLTVLTWVIGIATR